MYVLMSHMTVLYKLEMQLLRVTTSLGNAQATLRDYDKLVSAIISAPEERVWAVLSQHRDRGASPALLATEIGRARDGETATGGWTQRERDLACLHYLDGGHRATQLRHLTGGGPSLSVLRPDLATSRIAMNHGPVDHTVITQNLRQCYVLPLLDAVKGREEKLKEEGGAVAFDEIKLDDDPAYDPTTGKLSGACFEHACSDDLLLDSQTRVDALAAKFDAKEVHMGTEMSVAGIITFGRRHIISGIVPIFTAPTCKSACADVMEIVIQTLLDTIDAEEALRGVLSVWCFCTDGDATRRAAGFRLFFKRPISPDDPLFQHLGELLGFNMFVGDKNRTLDFDWRHVFKSESGFDLIWKAFY